MVSGGLVLKRILLTLVLAAALSAAVVLPASAAPRAAIAGATPSPSSACPPGSQDPSYCAPKCVVPQLVGYSIRQSVSLLHAADCRLGKVIIMLNGAASEATLTSGQFSLFTVVSQSPPAGSVRPDGWRVEIVVHFTG